MRKAQEKTSYIFSLHKKFYKARCSIAFLLTFVKKLRIIPKIMKTLENPEKNGEEEPKAQETISKLKGEE